MYIDIEAAIEEWEELGGYESEKRKATKNKSTEKKQRSAAEFIEPDGYVIYTDGSMRGTGTGGYCSVVMKDHEFVTAQGRQMHNTTNNQMEILGVFSALCYVKYNKIDRVTIYSDSEYVVKGINEWGRAWMRNNWRTSGGKPVANQDLWEKMFSILHNLRAKGGLITIAWISGHHGTEGNERADKLANYFSDLDV